MVALKPNSANFLQKLASQSNITSQIKEQDMKKTLSKTKMAALLVIGGATVLPLSSALAQSMRVQLDGQILNTQVPPVQRNNRTLLPMRDIFEALGASVQWDNATQSINAVQGNNQIWLQIGNRGARVNSDAVQLDQAAFLYQGVTMVPLRFVAEALGAQVAWNDALKLVSITRNGTTPVPTPPPTQLATLAGTVTRDISSDQFELRGDNGQTYQIRRRTGGALPRIGERIEARGNFDGNIFVAESVALSSVPVPTPTPAPVATAIDFEATVTAIQSAARITVRRDSGIIYTVNTRTSLPNSVNIGDRVRITGETSGGNVANVDRILLVQSGEPTRGAVSFEAAVTEVQSLRQIIVRRDNNTSYTVTSQENLPANLANGDRVQINGDLTGRNLVSVTRVTRVGGTGNNNNPRPGLTVRLRGTVESSQGRMLQIRGEDNKLYSVRIYNDSRFANGEFLRIIGTYDNDIIVATNIQRGRG